MKRRSSPLPLRLPLTALLLAMAAASLPVAAQTTINLTAVDGYPPKSLWIKEFIEFYIPEVDKRLAKDNKYKIRWNQAWSPTTRNWCPRPSTRWPRNSPPSKRRLLLTTRFT